MTLSRLLPLLPGAACVLLLSTDLPTGLWPVLLLALVSLGLAVAVRRATAATAFALIVVALAALQADTGSWLVPTVTGLLLGLYLLSLGARAAPDREALRAWSESQWRQVVTLVVGVAMVPLGLLLPVGAPLIAVAAGGVSVAIAFWCVRSRFMSA